MNTYYSIGFLSTFEINLNFQQARRWIISKTEQVKQREGVEMCAEVLWGGTVPHPLKGHISQCCELRGWSSPTTQPTPLSLVSFSKLAVPNHITVSWEQDKRNKGFHSLAVSQFDYVKLGKIFKEHYIANTSHCSHVIWVEQQEVSKNSLPQV